MRNNLATGLKLFDNACSYSRAAKLLRRKTGESGTSANMHIGQSAAIYAGLAVEYYLKTLFFLEHKKEYNERGKRPHNFHAFYAALRQTTRKDLEYLFTNLTAKRNLTGISALEIRTGKQIPRDLGETLLIWTDSFSRAHLPARPVDHTPMLFFGEIEEVLTSVILAQKPEWEQYLPQIE